MSAVKKVERLTFPFQTPDPFLFAVYHDDKYPPGDGQMRAPRTGNGADFNPSASYRMYHGERVPGFPQHPHRGFETITATMEGLVDHTDSVGNAGRYGQGDVQWMTAGKGIVHSEMPEQEDGLLMGFQLWINLPAEHKMTEPGYQEFSPEGVPLERRDNGTEVRVVSGETTHGTTGPVENTFVQPTYLDVQLPAGQRFRQPVAADDQAFVFVIDGELSVGGQETSVGRRVLGILGEGEQIEVQAGDEGCTVMTLDWLGRRTPRPAESDCW